MKRLSIDIDDKHNTFIQSIPWGYKCELIRALIQLSINAINEHGLKVLPDIINKRCEIKYKETEQDG